MSCISHIHVSFLSHGVDWTNLKPFENPPLHLDAGNLTKHFGPDFGSDHKDDDIGDIDITYKTSMNQAQRNSHLLIWLFLLLKLVFLLSVHKHAQFVTYCDNLITGNCVCIV